MLTLVLTGTVLRCWQPSHMAVEHFDEGVYASNLYCSASDYTYPFQHLYAPPLLPRMLELVLTFCGQSAGSVMWVNVAVGCLLIPSIWWMGRCWFGPLAGLTSAALASISEVHILYSRAALTDELLCLWMLWGVFWAWRALLTGRAAAIFLAGLFASVAWWTKYSGWLTLAISGAGTLAWSITSAFARLAGDVSPPIGSSNPEHSTSAGIDDSSAHQGTDVPRSTLVILRWGLIAALALLGWLPYLNSLQVHGGYAAVAANHSGYVVGWQGWGAGLQRQWDNLNFVETWRVSGAVTLLSLLILWWLVGKNLPAQEHSRRCKALSQEKWLLIIGTYVVVFKVGTSLPLLLMAAIGLYWLVARVTTGSNSGAQFAGWMLAAWIIGLTVAIPLYHPYLRLTLPWVVAIWLGAGLGFQSLVLESSEMSKATLMNALDNPPKLRMVVAAIALSCGFLFFLLESRESPAWEDRTGLRSIAREVHAFLPSDGLHVVYVLGEPALFFHLAAQSESADRLILPKGDFASIFPPQETAPPLPMFVVYGPHVMRAQTDPAAGISWAEAHFHPLKEWEYQPSTLVLLNEFAPSTIEAGEVEPSVVRLGRVAE